MKSRLSAFLQSNINVTICRTIGWKRANAYVRFLGALYFLLRRKEKSVIRQNVGTVFAIRRQDPFLCRLHKSVLTGIAMHYYEKLFNAFSSEEASWHFFENRVVDDGLAAVEKARSHGRGVLLVTGHYGGVEFIPGYLGGRGFPVSIVARFASDRLRRISQQKGGRFGIRIIDADKTPNVFFAICRHLRQNRVVITQCDEIDEWRPGGGRAILFLGRRTSPDRTLNLLVQRAGCRVVLAMMHRRPAARYRFIAKSLDAAEREISGGQALSVAEIGLKFVENFIYRYPEDWYLWKKVQSIAPAAPSVAELPEAAGFTDLPASLEAAA